MKLTSDMLKKIIKEEAAKLKSEPVKDTDVASKADETDADEYADSVEKHVDFVKALKLEETRITKRLKKIKEQKARAMQKLLSKI